MTAGGPGVGIGAMQRDVSECALVRKWRERIRVRGGFTSSFPFLFAGPHSRFLAFDRFVLQNRVLFLLAEQPPADMLALLGIFRSSVPPLVKRKMKELLSTIKDAVKRGMSIAQLGTEEQKGPESAKKDVVMLDAELKALTEEKGARQQQQEAKFWGQNGSSPGATPSSLLGSSQSMKGLVGVIFTTLKSTLFANSRNKIQASINPRNSRLMKEP